MEYSMTFFARGVWGSFPIVTMSPPEPVWTIFSTSSRIFLRSTSRFFRTLAATPEPSLTRPNRMCSVPMYSWLKRCASWLASCITLRARSVKRSYMPAYSSAASGGASGGGGGGGGRSPPAFRGRAPTRLRGFHGPDFRLARPPDRRPAALQVEFVHLEHEMVFRHRDRHDGEVEADEKRAHPHE